MHNPRYIGHQINPVILCINNNGIKTQLGRLQNGLFKATKCFISKHQKWWNNFTNYYDNNFDWSSLIKRELVHFLPLKNLRITIRRKSLESLQVSSFGSHVSNFSWLWVEAGSFDRIRWGIFAKLLMKPISEVILTFQLLSFHHISRTLYFWQKHIGSLNYL